MKNISKVCSNFRDNIKITITDVYFHFFLLKFSPICNLFTYVKSTVLNAVETLTCGRPDDIAVDSTLFRVQWVFSALNRASAVYNIRISVIEALQEAGRLLGDVNEDVYYQHHPLKVFSGYKGRPIYEIPYQQLELFLEYKFSLKMMEQMLGVSVKTVGWRLKELGLSFLTHILVSMIWNLTPQLTVYSMTSQIVVISACQVF